MSRYENRQELANKIDWEGGIHEMLFGYGLSRGDLPQDDDELLVAFEYVEELLATLDGRIERFASLLPEPGGEDE
jgi:hypothetical protein